MQQKHSIGKLITDGGRILRAFGAPLLGLPVIVARAHLLVAISARRNTQARGAALETEEHAWLLVRCRRATIGTPRFALCMPKVSPIVHQLVQ